MAEESVVVNFVVVRRVWGEVVPIDCHSAKYVPSRPEFNAHFIHSHTIYLAVNYGIAVSIPSGIDEFESRIGEYPLLSSYLSTRRHNSVSRPRAMLSPHLHHGGEAINC